MLAARREEFEQAAELLELAKTQMDELTPANPRMLLIRGEAESLAGPPGPDRKSLPEKPAGENG